MHTTREDWLVAAVAKLRELFERAGYPLEDTIKVSCGWPGGGSIIKRAGECWAKKCSATGLTEIFISPLLALPLEGEGVLATLVHELVHAAVGVEAGHKAAFTRAAKALGLEGKMTTTHAGEALLLELGPIADSLGPYPHAALTPSVKDKKQGTRMKKLQCPGCECIIRTTQSWIDAYPDTAWPCPCGGKFVVGC